ncbi:hypothetical protein B9Z19DRAFT_1103715 [Tuber borchii]|uniref:Uncharacterized protein n=1 Tax=Tuber borchii TaxID=42251 RepID=A0A2T6ZEK9_TUBBO|nr:hypothetical protein B9Z19DRAFT_1103715 [Tuber borchii]
MLPTPTASHLSSNHIYEPSDDTFLLLNTLTPPIPLSTLPLSANLLPPSSPRTRQRSITTLSTEISPHAPKTTKQTVAASLTKESGYFLGAIRTDLATGLRSGVADMLVFNSPYVPTEVVEDGDGEEGWIRVACGRGVDGTEVTNRVLEGLSEYLSECGVGNKPKMVAERLEMVKKVGTSGRKGGWEVLGICRVMKW